jgi:hypothetical protein
MSVEKTKVMRISRHPFPAKLMIDQKQLENVESAFIKRRALFTSKMGLELRKKLVKCYIWSRPTTCNQPKATVHATHTKNC